MGICSDCKGKKVVTCPECGGTGNRYYVPVLDIWESDCSACFGSGLVACKVCETSPLGSGLTRRPAAWAPPPAPSGL
jgi:DnaJ-class molecular chaperone